MFSFQEDSFAEILNSKAHVTLSRNSKNEFLPQAANQRKTEEQEQQRKPQKPPYMPTPTRRGQVRRVIRSDDSIEPNPYDLWSTVSDESFLEQELACQSPVKSGRSPRKSAIEGQHDTTLLFDIQAPSFVILDSDDSSDNSLDGLMCDKTLDDSVFEHPSMLSPMQRVALRRPSTILEESTIRSIDTSEERSVGSLSLKQSVNVTAESNQTAKTRSFRPSILNVFPTRSRIGFYDNLDTSSSPVSTKPSVKEVTRSKAPRKSVSLIKFDSSDQDSPYSRPAREATSKKTICLMDTSIVDSSVSNLSVDQTQYNSSFSDNEQPDQFNDTLEAVDYYMKQGKKILDRTSASTTLLQPSVIASPKNRNNSLLKQTLVESARKHLMNGDNNVPAKANKKLF